MKSRASIMNLGRLALASNDYESAEKYFQKAASLRPIDVDVLTALAYSQDSNPSLRTGDPYRRGDTPAPPQKRGQCSLRLAAAALALNQPDVVERELTYFLQEDPTNPLAPDARHNLELLQTSKNIVAGQNAALKAKNTQLAPVTSASLSNSARLKSELKALADEDRKPVCGLRSAGLELAGSPWSTMP